MNAASKEITVVLLSFTSSLVVLYSPPLSYCAFETYAPPFSVLALRRPLVLFYSEQQTVPSTPRNNFAEYRCVIIELRRDWLMAAVTRLLKLQFLRRERRRVGPITGRIL